MDTPTLHNVFWRCLSGPHAHLSTGNERVRRYRPGFSPIAAFADPGQPDLEGLAVHSQPGEAFYAAAWNGPNRSSAWSIEFDGSMVAMAWDAPDTPPPAPVACQALQGEHQEAMLALVALTNPGPFGPRNLSMGEFVGHVAPDGQLLAMAGERTRAEQWHEVSGICTHPDHQGRQLAYEVVRRMLLRGESPYLHVRADNAVARQMYRKLGFREALETPIRVIRRV